MAKKICVVCNKDLGVFAGKLNIQDGAVCKKCIHGAGMDNLQNYHTYNSASINELISSRLPLVSSFAFTKNVSHYLLVDENNKAFKVGLHDIFEYDNLLSFELLENGESITKGGLGSAVAGGLLFGGVGAIVGSAVGGKKSKGVCSSMKIRITLKNAHTDTVFIELVYTDTKTDTMAYAGAQDSAQRCLSALQIIADTNGTANTPVVAAGPSVDVAAEIQKFYNLKERGIISEDEFNIKKSQLLGI